MSHLLICFGQGKDHKPSVCVSVSVFFKVFCLIFVLLMLSGCQGEPETAQTFIEKGRAHVRQYNTRKAITEYKNALLFDSENDIAHFELAENYVLINSVSEAITAYQAAADINPKNKYAKLRLGQIYLETGKTQDAREMISAVLETDPKTIEAYHLLSSIQIRERDFDEAIRTLKKAVLISEKDIKTRFALASLYEVSSKPDMAEAMYIEILAIDSSRRGAYMKLCKLYRKNNAWDKMEALLLHILGTPGIKEAKLTDLARFYEGQKKYSTAETYYNRAVDESPQSVQAIMNLAEFYTRRNERDNATGTMKKAVKLEPDNPKCLAGLAQVYLAFNLSEYSWHEIGKVREDEKNDSDVVFTQGKLIMKGGDFKGAYDYFNWVIKQGFINADAYYSRAICIKHHTSPDDPLRKKMKKDFQAALLLEPDMLKARIELIEIYLHEREKEKAAEYLCFAFRKSPRNPKLLILLAALEFLWRDLNGAREIYTAIVEQNPSYIPGHLRLALLYTASGKTNQAVRSYLRAYETDPRQVSILKKISNIFVNKKRYKKAMEFLNSAKIPRDKASQAFVENLRGEISVKAGEKSKAINSFQASIALDPAAIAPRINMARLFMKSKQMGKAKTIYEEIERTNPNHLSMLTALGVIHAYQGNPELAESYYRRILAIDAVHGYASNNLAYLLAEADRDTSEALVLGGTALYKIPNNPNVFDTMGWIYYRKGCYLYAILSFKESLALESDNPIVYYHLGMALYKTNESKKARSYFEKALRLDHDFKYAEEIRKRLK